MPLGCQYAVCLDLLCCCPLASCKGLDIVRPSSIQIPVSATNRTSNTPTYDVPLSHSAPTASSTHLPPPPPPPNNHPSGRPAYQPINPENRDKFCTDYYVVMTPMERSISQEQAETSDYSGSSQTSEHLSFLETHNRNTEKTLKETREQLSRVTQDVSLHVCTSVAIDRIRILRIFSKSAGEIDKSNGRMQNSTGNLRGY